jgi:hypothetical protein
MKTFKEFYSANTEQEKFVYQLAYKMAQQLKASQTPVVTMAVRPGGLPINAYKIPSNEISKRLGIMERRYIPWLMQYGILANDPDNGYYKNHWIIDADRLGQTVGTAHNAMRKITNNNLFQAAHYLTSNLYGQMNRSNPSLRKL